MKKFLQVALILILILVLGGAAAGWWLYTWGSKDLPSFTRITDYSPPLVTTVFARDGSVLGYFYKEKRFLVKLDEMPAYLPKAFLAAEDSSFYEHEGIDIVAVMRAFIANMKAGGIKQGGSTITQQIIKRLLLSPEKSYTRKIKEAILAYRLEHYLTKDEILTIYLNQIYLGAGAYGVEAAARGYFGKHVDQLSIAESAMLAGLPQAPSRYNPYQNYEQAVKRQEYVLARMVVNGWITRDQYDQALAEPIALKSMADPSWQQGAYALEEVRRMLIEHFGEDRVYNGGLKVRTSIDMHHQITAENSLRSGLVAVAKRQGWSGPIESLPQARWQEFLSDNAVPREAIEPGQWIKVLVTKVSPKAARVAFGEHAAVLPVAGMDWARKQDTRHSPESVPKITDASKVLKEGDIVWASVLELPDPSKGREFLTMNLEREPEVEGALVSMRPDNGDVLALVGGYSFARSQFNRATQALRQPGSSFKPIVYSTALDNGFTAASIVNDTAIVFTDGSNETWKPENFEGVFYGPTLLRTALAKSRNLVTIRVAQKVGIEKVIGRAKALGLHGNFQPNLSMALGATEVTPINLCQAYTAFARMGSWVKPRIVLDVESAWGESLYHDKVEPHEAITPQNAYIMDYLLQQVVQDGTGWRAKALGRPVAGKTGTSNDTRDAWFMGFTPYLVTGVFVGFDDNKPMGKWEVGGRAACPIWVDYRKAVEAEFPEQEFLQPEGIVMANVDATSGMLASSNSSNSYLLPFVAGTEPTQAASSESGGLPSTSGEDLLKQLF